MRRGARGRHQNPKPSKPRSSRCFRRSRDESVEEKNRSDSLENQSVSSIFLSNNTRQASTLRGSSNRRVTLFREVFMTFPKPPQIHTSAIPTARNEQSVIDGLVASASLSRLRLAHWALTQPVPGRMELLCPIPRVDLPSHPVSRTARAGQPWDIGVIIFQPRRGCVNAGARKVAAS